MKLLAIVFALLCASVAQAGGPYRQNCSYVPGYGYSTYTSNVTNITAAPYNWKQDHAKIALYREDHQAYLQSLQALGYGGSSGAPNQYGNSSYSQYTAPQGNSVYGYNETASLYSNVDLGALYSAAARLTSDAQQYSANAMAGHQGLVGQAADVHGRALEIQEKAKAMSMAIRAAGEATKPGDSATITRNYVGSQPNGQGVQARAQVNLPVPQAPQPGTMAELPASIQACAACHQKEKRLAIDFNLTPEQRLDCLRRIRLPMGHADHMPKGREQTAQERAESEEWFLGIQQ